MGFIIYCQKYGWVIWFFWNWAYSARNTRQNQDKSITHNIFRIQNYDSIMSGFNCLAFIEHMPQGRIQRFLKWGALYVNHHGWPAKKTLGFRWSKKAKVTLETISFWQNISSSIFTFSWFLSIKSDQFFQNLLTLW